MSTHNDNCYPVKEAEYKASNKKWLREINKTDKELYECPGLVKQQSFHVKKIRLSNFYVESNFEANFNSIF